MVLEVLSDLCVFAGKLVGQRRSIVSSHMGPSWRRADSLIYHRPAWSWSAEARLNVESVQSARAVAPTQPSGDGDGNVNLDVPFLAADDAPIPSTLFGPVFPIDFALSTVTAAPSSLIAVA